MLCLRHITPGAIVTPTVAAMVAPTTSLTCGHLVAPKPCLATPLLPVKTCHTPIPPACPLRLRSSARCPRTQPSPSTAWALWWTCAPAPTSPPPPTSRYPTHLRPSFPWFPMCCLPPALKALRRARASVLCAAVGAAGWTRGQLWGLGDTSRAQRGVHACVCVQLVWV